MSREVLLSVLVPVFNTENYLGQCLEGLCRQTLRQIEVLCINDGSTDSSMDIMLAFAAKDSRIRIIDKPNSGYGATLNCGISEARGEYVGIVESDDFADPKMFKTLYLTAKRFDCNVVKCNYYNSIEGVDYKIPNFDMFSYGAFPYKKAFNVLDYPSIVVTNPAVWSGIYRRSILGPGKAEFRESPGAAYQDTSFAHKVWFVAETAALVRKPLLHYRIDNPTSSVKRSANVYAVCDELAESERFLREETSYTRAFLPWLYVDKWSKMRWNYGRIAEEYKVEFVRFVQADYGKDMLSEEFDKSLFSTSDWNQITTLLETDAEEYVRTYPDVFR